MSSKFQFVIDGRKIGPDEPPYIIAELSANHNGSKERALKSIEAAADAGADAVKIQSYTPDTITINSRNKEFMIEEGLWQGQSLYELYQTAYTPFEWHPDLFDKARSSGITMFSSPFDFSAVELLQSLDAPAYKIASFELVDVPLIRKAAQTGKPIIMSTGMASLEDIELAVNTVKETGNEQIALLHCVSSYPAPVEDINLKTLLDLKEKFAVTVGLSDHSLGTKIPVAATALGATIIEKHFMLDNDGGPDSSFSLTSEELKMLVDDTADAWRALGNVQYGALPREALSTAHRRSLYIVKDMVQGEILSEENLRSIRPGNGLPPKYYDELLGLKVSTNVKRATPMTWDLIDD